MKEGGATMMDVLGPRRGSPRVQAWVRKVIAPLIDGLPARLADFRRGVIGWSTPTIGFVRSSPIVYCMRTPGVALADIRRALPNISSAFDEAYEVWATAVRAAQAAHDFVLSNHDFVKLTTEYHDDHRPHDRLRDLQDYVIVRLINQHPLDEACGFPGDDFCKAHHERLLAFTASPEFAAVREATKILADQTERLLAMLKELHWDLLETYDVEPE